MLALLMSGGGLIGFGVFWTVRHLIGVPCAPRRSPIVSLGEHYDLLGVRIGLAAVAAMVMGVATAWPVGVAAAGLCGFLAPSMRGAKGRREAGRAKLEAIATWTEQIRDLLSGKSGLQYAIMKTAGVAPPPLRNEVRALTAALEMGVALPAALSAFAAAVDEEAADKVVAALMLAAERPTRSLKALLGRLASTTRDDVAMRLRVDTSRARTRTATQLITLITVVMSFGLVVFNPTYVAAYQSPVGQTMLLVVAGFFAGAYWWLGHANRPSPGTRFLVAGHSPRPLEAARKR